MNENVRESTTAELKEKMEEARKAYLSIKKTVEKREEEEEAERKKKLNAEKESRRAEIETKYKELQKLIGSFTHDYGVLKMNFKGDDFSPFWRMSDWF